MLAAFRELNSIHEINRPVIRLLEPAIRAYPFCLPRLLGGSHYDFINRQQVSLLCFWSTEHSASKNAVNHLDQWYRNSPVGNFNVIAINCDPFKPRASFNSKNLTGVTMLWDQEGTVQKMYNVLQLPTTFIVDKRGNIRDEKPGGPTNDWARLAQRISDLTKESF